VKTWTTLSTFFNVFLTRHFKKRKNVFSNYASVKWWSLFNAQCWSHGMFFLYDTIVRR